MTLANRRILWYAPISDYIRHASGGIVYPFLEVRTLSYTAQTERALLQDPDGAGLLGTTEEQAKETALPDIGEP